jgi:predicted translation initiation factor SUI1
MPQQAPRTVLFLCTGNYYRSRLAEVFFNSVATKMGLGWRAVSRGLALERGTNNTGPVAKIAMEAIKARGINSGEAFTRLPLSVSTEDLQSAQRIVALHDIEHRPLIMERHPTVLEQVEFWEVPDEPGVTELIDAEVKGLVARLMTGGTRQGPPVLSMPEPPAAPVSLKPITLKVGRETAGRNGKPVTTIFDTPLDEAALQTLATRLKQKCGTGGTVKNSRIEIQGDQRERVIAELEKLGYRVKRVGG